MHRWFLVPLVMSLALVGMGCERDVNIAAPGGPSVLLEPPCADEDRAVEMAGTGWGWGEVASDPLGLWRCDPSVKVWGDDSVRNGVLTRGNRVELWFARYFSTGGTTVTATWQQKIQAGPEDILRVFLNGVEVATGTGVADWTEVSRSAPVTGTGVFELRFRYEQNGATPGWVWLDHVRMSVP